MGMRGEIFHTHAELERNVALLCHRGRERRLQVAAMDHPVRRAVALRRRAERDADDFAAGPADQHAQCRRRGDVPPQSLAETEIDQGARGVGRELDAGAGFFKPLRLLQDDDAETAARQRQRGGEPANTGAGDDNDAQGGHGNG